MSREAPIALGFSGGLDTSFCVPWLGESTGREIVTVFVDTLGLTSDEAADLEARALGLGAARHVRVDAVRPFFDEVLRFLLYGNVRRGGAYPLCVGAERGLQARELARVAKEVGASAVAHGCTAAGNDQIRFEVALRTLAPELDVIAPVRDEPRPRAEQVEFLESRGLRVPEFGAAYSINRGLWGITIGGRETLGSEAGLPEEAWVVTRGAFDAPRAPEQHTLDFEAGVPVALDGERMDPVTLITAVERLAAAFGIGRGIHLGDTILGTKGRVAFEAPAAETLILAHRELEKLVLTGRQSRVKNAIGAQYGDLVHEGQHLDPVCRDMEALLESSQERVTGRVHVLLRPGSIFVEGVTSPYSLLSATRGVYGEAAGEWTASDSRGLAKMAALPAMLSARATARRTL